MMIGSMVKIKFSLGNNISGIEIWMLPSLISCLTSPSVLWVWYNIQGRLGSFWPPCKYGIGMKN